MERHAFLQSLPWLTRFGGADTPWPPRQGACASHRHDTVLLEDCSCFFHVGDRVCFFRVGSASQDATQMTFQLAIVCMSSKARHGSPRHVDLSGSSTEDDRAVHSEDEGEHIRALFFRLDGCTYLVDHTSIQTITMPKHATAAAASHPEKQVPPWAALAFESVTLRFWMSRTSLSPLNASQPLIRALEAMNRTLTAQTWTPVEPMSPPTPSPEALRSSGSQRSPGAQARGGELCGGGERARAGATEAEGCFEAQLAAADSFLQIVDATLHPPYRDATTGGWSEDDAGFLLTQAAHCFTKAMGRKRRRSSPAVDMEALEHQRLNQVLDQLFPGNTKAPLSEDVTAGLLSNVEEYMASLRRVVRAKVAEKYLEAEPPDRGGAACRAAKGPIRGVGLPPAQQGTV